MLSKLKGIKLQAFDCVRRQNPRTGRKSSEVFKFDLDSRRHSGQMGKSLISILYLPVSLLEDSEIIVLKHYLSEMFIVKILENNK